MVVLVAAEMALIIIMDMQVQEVQDKDMPEEELEITHHLITPVQVEEVLEVTEHPLKL